MRHTITIILLAAFISIGHLSAQETITVNASNTDISDNLDLEAVAYLFGEAKNLEQFEKMLNDPEKQVSNLDLNGDGYIDYLRVIESSENGVYVVVIQAVLGEDIFQDVATIDVDTRNKEKVAVMIIGNEYLYGTNYIFEPVYVHRPFIYDYFWYPQHVVWYSPYYWHYYPRYYHYRKPHRIHVYHQHIYSHYHKLDCRYQPYHRIDVAVNLHKKYHRNDYEQRHPEKTFTQRNQGVENRKELVQRRSSSPNTENRRATNSNNENKSRMVSPGWEPKKSEGRRSSSTETKSVSVPQKSGKSTTIDKSRRASSSESRTVVPTVKSSSGNSKSGTDSRRTYSAPKTEQKSAPVVKSKPTETRSSSSSTRSSSNSSGKSSSVTAPARRESSKPAVSSSSKKSSSGSSSKPSVQKSSSSSKSSSSAPKSRSSSSGSSSSKSASEKSKNTSRR